MKGQTLLEVLIGLTTAVVIIGAITALLVSSLNNTIVSNNQVKATAYAKEGMEFIRSLRDANYTEFATYNGLYCLGSDDKKLTNSPSCTEKNIGSFIRSVFITQAGCGTDVSKVVVTVSWTDSKCSLGVFCHKTELTSCFSTIVP